MTRRLIIAIDGPAASGKSSAAKELARRLGYLYLDTGALYRAIAWKMIKQEVNLENAVEVGKSCQALQIKCFVMGEITEVWVNELNATPFLRLPKVTEAASKVAAIPAVRDKLLSIQREIGIGGGVIAEGRDIGTVVFPEADLKFYLKASVSVRGERRHNDLLQSGSVINLSETTRDLKKRDLNDSQRALAPLKQGDDAVLIDSTALDLEAVVDKMFQEVEKVFSRRREAAKPACKKSAR